MTSSNSSDIAHRDQLTSSSSSAYVRPIKPSEIPVLAAIYQRAFARDPMMNWFGGVRTLVPHYTAQDPHTRRTLTALGHFQLVLVKMAQISGLGTVIVERSGEGKEGPGREAEEAEERIVGGALWLSPGMSMDPSPLTFVRISPWKAVWNWGLGALKVSGSHLGVAHDVWSAC
ncbi:hypothetical protein B0F90DRAFT_941485 [Multifurca ochricompacta]|uniref:N-acetyltransferase domain-containing protein n=1 Tax=Multifurca ochricompacta TaxID=376703 RepID=A0AAD4MA97_9AGAM|nr:hypothetical protein B0F90DRAFT_941485 [Multifurca ochricompacta]